MNYKYQHWALTEPKFYIEKEKINMKSFIYSDKENLLLYKVGYETKIFIDGRMVRCLLYPIG